MPHTVVCFGDSITRGLVSANYVEILTRRLGGYGFMFVNEGINNDYSYNLLRRVEDVVAHQPRTVIILIGTNDVISTLIPHKRAAGRLSKGLPRWPNREWFCENLFELVSQVRVQTHARIGIGSIPVLGEDLESLPNVRVRSFNQAIQELCASSGVSYIAVHENQARYLASIPPARKKAYQGAVHLTFELAFRRLLHNETFDSFSRRKGYTILTDGIHMNTIGARIIADQVEVFLRSHV
jgi:lysophospholipase L1-like esterase